VFCKHTCVFERSKIHRAKKRRAQMVMVCNSPLVADDEKFSLRNLRVYLIFLLVSCTLIAMSIMREGQRLRDDWRKTHLFVWGDY